MKRGQKHAVRHPWLFIQLCEGFVLQIIKCYFCSWRKIQTFMRVLYSATSIVAHASLPMLAWTFQRGLNTSVFGLDSDCISGLVEADSLGLMFGSAALWLEVKALNASAGHCLVGLVKPSDLITVKC